MTTETAVRPLAWYEAFQIVLGLGGMFFLALLVLLLALGLVMLARRGRRPKPARLRVKKLNDTVQEYERTLLAAVLPPKEAKARAKEERKADKERAKDAAHSRPRVYVIDFDGDIAASQVEALREQVTALLEVASSSDEVVVRLESPGGVVHGYGLAASQLERVRAKGVPLTVCVDKVAASGGYMMACIADKVLAAPFAVLGSIGVVASLPNFNRVLRKNDVDYLEFTAGEYKRTVGPLAEVTERGRAKFQEHLEDTHLLFKEFVIRHRPRVDLARVATGEHWFGLRAVELGLVDVLSTSDAYLRERCAERDVFLVEFDRQVGFREKITQMFTWWAKLSLGA
jgi:serine protease SohB